MTLVISTTADRYCMSVLVGIDCVLVGTLVVMFVSVLSCLCLCTFVYMSLIRTETVELGVLVP